MGTISKIDGFDTGILTKVPSNIRKAKSVYIYGLSNIAADEQLLKFLSNDPKAEIRQLETTKRYLSINKNFPEICGPLSGLCVPVFSSDVKYAFHIPTKNEQNQSLISINEGDIFLSVKNNDVRYYLNPCNSVIDIDQKTSKQYFDVKDYFCRSVPLVMYIIYTFSSRCFRGLENNACLIVDDPLLRRKYGYFNYREVLELMMRFGFTTNISFIPCNYNSTVISLH